MPSESPRTPGRAYGIDLDCRLPLKSRLAPAEGPAVLSVRVGGDDEREWEPAAYRSPFRDERGESVLIVHRGEEFDRLRFPGVAEFRVGRERIEACPVGAAQDHMLEIRLLGTVLTFWLERLGVPALHASAVVVSGRAVLFLSAKEGGKTSLACSFLEAGHRLLADDIVPIEVEDGIPRARPSHPNLRLWPREAERFLGSVDGLDRYHPDYEKRLVPVGPAGFGEFESRPRPVARVYLPRRRPKDDPDESVQLRTLGPAESAVELTRNSFAAPLVEGLGWQEHRLSVFAELIRAAPVRRLDYPSGYDRLPAVRDAIVTDLSVSR